LCDDTQPTVLFDRDSFSGEEISIGGSWSLNCGGVSAACIAGGDGTLSFAPQLVLQRPTTRFRIFASWGQYAAGTLSLALSYDNGLTFPVLQALPVDFAINQAVPFWSEVDINTSTSTFAAFELRAAGLDNAWGNSPVMIRRIVVEQLGSCP
jgi:hypothetical protein